MMLPSAHGRQHTSLFVALSVVLWPGRGYERLGSIYRASKSNRSTAKEDEFLRLPRLALVPNSKRHKPELDSVEKKGEDSKEESE